MCYCFKGCPTWIEQSCPGCPCAGFNLTELLGFACITGVVAWSGTCGCTDAACGLEFKGAPTAISQRWPGCPCAGLSAPAATGEALLTAGLTALLEITGFACIGAALCAGCCTCIGAEFRGAPTAISHRWPGAPCAGFTAAVKTAWFGLAMSGLTESVAFNADKVGSVAGVETSAVSSTPPLLQEINPVITSRQAIRTYNDFIFKYRYNKQKK